MASNNAVRGLLALTAFSLPQLAHAHLVSTRFGEFYSGLLHPLTTLVHLVPWLALAMFVAMAGKPLARRSLWLFPLAVGSGVWFGLQWGGNDQVLLLNILSFAVLGGLVAWSRPLPDTLGLVAVVLFAFSHGYANGDVDLADGSPVLYTTGVITAAYLVVALGAGAANVVNSQSTWGAIALRALGSWILAAGLIYGGFELTGVGSV